MNELTIKTLKKMQRDLLRIANKEHFFFNITKYKNLELIYEKSKYVIDSCGNSVRIGADYYLTEKGKQIVSVII